MKSTIWKIDRLAGSYCASKQHKLLHQSVQERLIRFYISHEERSLHLSVRYIRNVFASSKLSIGHLLKITLTLHIPDCPVPPRPTGGHVKRQPYQSAKWR